MRDHWGLLTALGFIIGFAAIFGIWMLYRRLSKMKWQTPSLSKRGKFNPRSQEYELVDREDRHEV